MMGFVADLAGRYSTTPFKRIIWARPAGIPISIAIFCRTSGTSRCALFMQRKRACRSKLSRIISIGCVMRSGNLHSVNFEQFLLLIAMTGARRGSKRCLSRDTTLHFICDTVGAVAKPAQYSARTVAQQTIYISRSDRWKRPSTILYILRLQCLACGVASLRAANAKNLLGGHQRAMMGRFPFRRNGLRVKFFLFVCLRVLPPHSIEGEIELCERARV